MPRSSSWRHSVSQILTALRMLDCEELHRAQIESLFGLQRRAALRLMAPLVSASRKGSWQVDRQRLMEWLEGFEQEASEEENRHRLVLQALLQKHVPYCSNINRVHRSSHEDPTQRT